MLGEDDVLARDHVLGEKHPVGRIVRKRCNNKAPVGANPGAEPVVGSS